MSQEPFAGESPDAPWAPPLEPELTVPPAGPPKFAVDTAPLSTAGLAAAGAACLNLLLTFAVAVAWMMNEEMGLSIISASNGLWLLLGFAAIGLGAYIQRQQKRALVKGGTTGMVANVATISGGLIMTTAMLLPMISAMRSIIGGGV